MTHHLTCTGSMAGVPYCGAARNPDDEYSHLPYGPADKVRQFVADHIDCEACREVYRDVYAAGGAA